MLVYKKQDLQAAMIEAVKVKVEYIDIVRLFDGNDGSRRGTVSVAVGYTVCGNEPRWVRLDIVVGCKKGRSVEGV